MKIVCGDILAIKRGVIVHQVNCKKVMGAGLALQIKRKYPQHFADFLSTEPKLGNIVTTHVSNELYVVGLYGQDGYGRTGQHTDYGAFSNAIAKAAAFAAEKSLPLYLPYGIGCGLAGGDWTRISGILSGYPECTAVIKIDDEDKAIAFWHENDTNNSLREFLQKSKPEYEAFVKG